MIDLAPVVLFVFNRPEQTQKTLLALSENKLASQTRLIVYSDGPRNQNDIENVDSVRNLLLSFECSFLELKVISRKNNHGLCDNIIKGVTDTCNKYGKAIILEDDIVTTPKFLDFMNDSLKHYQSNKDVWQISAYSYSCFKNLANDKYLLPISNCWGWATWGDRWQKFERDPDKLKSKFTKEDIYKFNLDGCYDYWQQVEANVSGKIRTWAVFWYSTIFVNDGLTLYSNKSFVNNIGLDGSGVHCRNSAADLLVGDLNVDYAKDHSSYPIEVDDEAFSLLKNSLRKFSPTLSRRIKAKIKSLF